MVWLAWLLVLQVGHFEQIGILLYRTILILTLTQPANPNTNPNPKHVEMGILCY